MSPSLRTVERLAQACRQRLDIVPEVDLADDERLDEVERGRLAANLERTPAERLARMATAANFVLRGRRAMAAADDRPQGG